MVEREPTAFEQNQNGESSSINTYEWCASGVSFEKENLQNLPPEVCSQNGIAALRNGISLIWQDLEEIKGKRSAAIL